MLNKLHPRIANLKPHLTIKNIIFGITITTSFVAGFRVLTQPAKLPTSIPASLPSLIATPTSTPTPEPTSTPIPIPLITPRAIATHAPKISSATAHKPVLPKAKINNKIHDNSNDNMINFISNETKIAIDENDQLTKEDKAELDKTRKKILDDYYRRKEQISHLAP